MVYRYLGDKRFVFALPRAITLQILHPANAAGLVQHVDGGLWVHKHRAVSQMIYIAYSNRDLRSVMRTAHADVKGIDSRGHRYHSLNPELFFFQHATYVDALFFAVETFIHRLSEDEKDQLYVECCRWYGKYDISDRAMPRTRAAFTAYFDDLCATHLSLSPDAETLRSEALRPTSWLPAKVPAAVIRAQLHPRAAELLGVQVTPADRAALRSFAASTKARAAITPPPLRLIPSARHDPDA